MLEETSDDNLEDGIDMCAVKVAKLGTFPLPMIPATSKNLDLGEGRADLDLAGVWWIRWRKIGNGGFLEWMGQQFYNMVKFEILFSFEGSQIATEGSGYPFQLNMSVGEKQQWAYGNIVTGRWFQLMQWINPIPWVFTNGSYASAGEPYNYGLIKETDDTWLRPTYEKGIRNPVFTYTMTRIVNGNGTQTKYWEHWMKSGTNIRVWNTPGGTGKTSKVNECRRTWTQLASCFYVPLEWSCKIVNAICAKIHAPPVPSPPVPQ